LTARVESQGVPCCLGQVFRAKKDPANQDDPETLKAGLDNLQAITIFQSSVQPDDPQVYLLKRFPNIESTWCMLWLVFLGAVPLQSC